MCVFKSLSTHVFTKINQLTLDSSFYTFLKFIMVILYKEICTLLIYDLTF